jgi:hypothetical protein
VIENSESSIAPQVSASAPRFVDLAKAWAWLSAAVVLGIFAALAISSEGAWLAIAVAAGVCWLAASAALWVSGLAAGSKQVVSGVLGGTLLRTGLPLAAGMWLQTNRPALVTAGVMQYLLGFFLLTLCVETYLVVRLTGAKFVWSAPLRSGQSTILRADNSLLSSAENSAALRADHSAVNKTV